MKEKKKITSLNKSMGSIVQLRRVVGFFKKLSTTLYLQAFVLISVVLGLSISSFAIDKSKGVYRIPYANGTKVYITNDHKKHKPIGRIDMSGKEGSSKYKIVAAADGYVRYIEDKYNKQVDSSSGKPCTNNYVWIEHTNGEKSKYSHMTGIPKLKVGQFVKVGTFLGYEGKVGCASGNHLHYEIAKFPESVKPTKVGGFVDKKYNLIPRICSIPKGMFESGKTYKARKVPGNLKPGFKEVAKHGLSSIDYQCQFDQAVNAGYELQWVDGFDVKGKLYFNVVFRPKTGGKWAAFHNLTSTQYQSRVNKYTNAKFKIRQVESYKIGNKVRYAVIFKKETGPSITAYHGYSVSQHQNKFNALTEKGWRPINISVVSVNGKLRYTALYKKTSIGSYIAKSFLTPAQFQQQFNANKKKERQIAYLNAYIHKGKPYFSAIWNSKTKGAYKAKHGLSGGKYQTEWKNATSSGLLTRNVTGYVSGNSVLYAGVWRN